MRRLWLHAAALLAAIALTLIVFEFWGRFAGAMEHFAELSAQQPARPMPVSVIPASPETGCNGKAPCPAVPKQTP